MTRERVPCLFCGALDASLLCDYVLGRDLHKAHVYPRLDPPDPTHTCDAPMCRSCARAVGWVCGQAHDTWDLCPVHHDEEDWLGTRNRLITADDAAAFRRRLEIAIRNGLPPERFT